MVPITSAANSAEFWSTIATQTDKISKSSEDSSITYVAFPNFKSKCMFIEPKTRDMIELIDLCKSVDVVILLSKESIDDVSLIDETAISFLKSLRSIGSPELLGVIQQLGLETDAKTQNECRVALQKFLQSNYQADCKVFDDTHPSMVCRHITSCSVRNVSWKAHRSCMISEISSMTITNRMPQSIQFKLNGYLRGRPMSVNSLIHIENVGTCRIVQAEAVADPFSKHRYNNLTAAERVTIVADPEMYCTVLCLTFQYA